MVQNIYDGSCGCAYIRYPYAEPGELNEAARSVIALGSRSVETYRSNATCPQKKRKKRFEEALLGMMAGVLDM